MLPASLVTTRQRLAVILLWGVLVFVGTMFGASVYQRISLIPEWGGALPQSVVRYFGDPRAGQAIDRFWTVVTAVYFIPGGVMPLMVRGGQGQAPETITRMARAWIFWDWFRMAGTLVSCLCFVKAASVQ